MGNQNLWKCLGLGTSGRPRYLRSPKAAQLQTQAPASPCQRETQRPKSNLGRKSTSPTWVSWRSTNRGQSPSWPKMAMIRISLKKGVLEKKCRSHRKSGLGPLYFSFEKSWGPKLGLGRILEKYGFPSGAYMLLWTRGKWVPGKHKIFLESLLHMVHVLQSSQKMRLASKKSSIFSGAIFPADVREIRHTKFCLKWLLGPSWAHLCF